MSDKIETVEDFSKKKVHFIRGELVVLDSDLAIFFETQTSQINRAVKRNKERFPKEFMFQLTEEEYMLCQNGIALKRNKKNLPYVFTEMGCWTLSLILTSHKATIVGTELLKTFKYMKDYLREQQNLPARLQRVLTTKSATINLYDSPGAIIVVGDSPTINQQVSSPEDVAVALKALLPIINKDHSEIATALKSLVEVIKNKDSSKIKDSVSTVSDLVNISNAGGPAILAVKTLLASLGLF